MMSKYMMTPLYESYMKIDIRSIEMKESEVMFLRNCKPKGKVTIPQVIEKRYQPIKLNSVWS